MIEELLSKPKKAKYLDQLKYNKYKMLCYTDDGMDKTEAGEVILQFHTLFICKKHVIKFSVTRRRA